MIIVKLMGGLGNQMFQYAAGKALAERTGTDLYLDLSFLKDRSKKENFTFRNFELEHFHLSFQEISKNKIYWIGLFHRFSHLTKSSVLNKITRVPIYYSEKSFQYNPEFETLGDNTYLDGFWQTEKYFSPFTPAILKAFRFKSEAKGENKKLLQEVQEMNSVSVHIRRGDYVSSGVVNNFHGICDITYYEKAIDFFKMQSPQPVFFFFSDDIEWVKKNIKLQGYTAKYIDHNQGSASFEDLRLMSNCRHNIVANSSFSWWGAWLNRNPNKIVYAPRNWFAEKSVDTGDVIPESWKKI